MWAENILETELYSAANDPQTGNDPEPHEMIPDVDRKWSRQKTRNGMELVSRVGFQFLT